MTTTQTTRRRTWADLRCHICQGSGTTYLEHPDGSLSQETCPYCHGRKNMGWVTEKFNLRHSKVEAVKIGIVVLFMTLCYTNSWPRWSWGAAVDGVVYWPWFVLHAALWLAFLAGLVWWYAHPNAKRAARKATKTPHPLTTTEEKVMGAAVLGGALLKAEWEHHNRH